MEGEEKYSPSAFFPENVKRSKTASLSEYPISKPLLVYTRPPKNQRIRVPNIVCTGYHVNFWPPSPTWGQQKNSELNVHFF